MNTSNFSQTNTLAFDFAENKSALLTAIIESSEDAIISKTLQGIITSWNPAAIKMFGFSEAEAVGKHISLIIPSDRLKEEDFIIGQVFQGNRIDHFETLRQHRDGSAVPISLSISPVRNKQGKIIGASKIARDISEQQKLAEKQGMLAAIVDSSDDTILSKTLDGIITSWNKAAEHMFGYPEAEAKGKHITLIIPKERLDEETFIIREIRKGNKVDHFQTERMAKDGTLIPISLSVSPILDRDGNVVGASKIARDISVQQADAAEKERLYEQVKALNTRKAEFIGLASHELKTPLTSINGYLQILHKSVKEEKSQQFLMKSQKQVKNLIRLVNDLLDITKIEEGKLNFIMDKFNIRDVVADGIELISIANNKHRINLHSDLNELVIDGDYYRVEQVVINLLTNAVRYAPDSHEIEVYLERSAEEVKVGVRDFGMGIPADKLENIFSRFYRVDDNSSVSGLGIGLYLSHQIITGHKGRIWVESDFGTGSIFWFSLPLTHRL